MKAFLIIPWFVAIFAFANSSAIPVQSTAVEIPVIIEVLEIFGFIKEIMSIYDEIASRWEPSDIGELSKQFQEASHQLEQIDQKLDWMMAQIRVEFVKSNLLPELKTIDSCDFALRQYLDCLNSTYSSGNETTCIEEKASFINNAKGSTGNQLENSIRYIMKSMAGNVQENDIPKVYREALDNYEYKLEEQLDEWMAWINLGMYIHAAYVQIQEIPVAQNKFFRSNLEEFYSWKIPEKRAKERELCRNESKVPTEISNVLHDCQSLSNEQTVGKLHEKLSDKYRTKKWFAAVYNDIVGYDKHCFDDSMPSSLHQWGKNAIVYSVAGNLTINQADKDYLTQHLNYGTGANITHNALYYGTRGRVNLAVIQLGNGLQAKWNQTLDTFMANGASLTVIALPPSATSHQADPTCLISNKQKANDPSTAEKQNELPPDFETNFLY